MRYNSRIEPEKRIKNQISSYGNKKIWQAIMIILISLVTIVTFLYLPWIIVSEDFKVNILQFSVSLNGLIRFYSALESVLNNFPNVGINIKDSVDAMKLFRTANYIAFAIPVVNIILILLAIFIKKIKTLFRFVVLIDMICVAISIFEIILLNYLQLEYKVWIITVYKNFHTDAYHVALSVEGFVETIKMAMSPKHVTEMVYLGALIRLSSFMTIVLSLINILVASIFYEIGNIRKMRRKQIRKKDVAFENI